MKKFITFYIILSFFMMIGVVWADHQNEPFAFHKIHKYKIGKSENYHKFNFDLQDNDLSKKVEEQLKNTKKTCYKDKQVLLMCQFTRFCNLTKQNFPLIFFVRPAHIYGHRRK